MTDLSPATKAFIDGLTFDADGLIPAIAQQHDSGEVLMMAWMNRQSIVETLTGGRVVYWSRSRQALWRKGDSSGQEQRLIEFRVDCDRDCLLLLVDQIGVACHTGRRNCFFTAIRDNNPIVVADVIIDPSHLYKGR
ncbi:MAG: phosphoribosyl-AMP cyclohydrolase [Rhodospirillaceae bacterium]|nr:phosphoribosyl-AMP cyclohydrolase [Rhodospirillaceae bacterium]